MEPETSTPNSGPEKAPNQYGPSIERAPLYPGKPEQSVENGAERHEQTSEQGAVRSNNTGMTSIFPAPVQPVEPVQQVTTSTGPLSAADEDLIEKEWVDRAKKIVAETQNDPYKREEAVNQLQRDYLKKRYGRELGQA